MTHPVDTQVGKRIRQRRWMIGMTQQQLAEAVGIKFQQIQKYETGTNRVSASRLFEIATALGVGIGYFFDGLSAAGLVGSENPELQGEEVGSEAMFSREAMELVRVYQAIPEAQRRRLLDLARVIAVAA